MAIHRPGERRSLRCIQIGNFHLKFATAVLRTLRGRAPLVWLTELKDRKLTSADSSLSDRLETMR